MTIIKTHLRTTATDQLGNIKLIGNGQNLAFSGVFKLGLILGSQDPETKRLPVDDNELPRLNDALTYVIDECLCGLSGIGRIITAGNSRHELSEDEAYGLGSVIQHLALLAQEILAHQETIAIDLRNRNAMKGDRS